MKAPSQKTIPYVDLSCSGALKSELLAAADKVLSSGGFILGEEVERFEQEFAEFCGTRFAVGVANGTDALMLALEALGIGPGDEVITVPNSFLATASSIVLSGARPVFVDVGDDYNMDPALIEGAITPRTKAILPVHLTGRPADMDAILNIAAKHSLAVVEDAAQAVGARYRDRPVGSFGNCGCFSLHPLKNLNACGDGGMITTDDEGVYAYLLKARNHGLANRDECEFWSVNSRLDALQAAFLRVKLRHLPEWTQGRRNIAALYRDRLRGHVGVPEEKSHEFSVYHTFVIRAKRRNDLQEHLKSRGIDTKIHYPIPIHLQPAAEEWGYNKGDFPVCERQAAEILSLPIRLQLTEADISRVCGEIERFCTESEEACSE